MLLVSLSSQAEATIKVFSIQYNLLCKYAYYITTKIDWISKSRLHCHGLLNVESIIANYSAKQFVADERDRNGSCSIKLIKQQIFKR